MGAVPATDFLTTIADFGINNKLVGTLAKQSHPLSDAEALAMRERIRRGKDEARNP